MARPRRVPPTGGIFSPTDDVLEVGARGAGSRALTAAGDRVTERRSQNYQRLNQRWQTEALTFYDTSGECWYAAQFYARAISKLRLYAAKVGENGEIEEIEIPVEEDEPEDETVEEEESGEEVEEEEEAEETEGVVAAVGDEGAEDEEDEPEEKKDTRPPGLADKPKELSPDDQAALDAVARIRDTSGGRSQLLGAWARLMFLTGETYLTVTQNPDTDEEVWECLSSDELRLAPGRGYVRWAAPSVPPEELDNVPDDQFEPLTKTGRKTAVVYRLWRRHPRYSMLADAPMRATLSLFEELQLLQLAVRARARSRLSGAGILCVPQEIIMANLPTGSENDPSKSPIMERLQRAATAAIQNPGSASAVVPIVIQGPSEHLKELRWVGIGNPMEKYEEQGLRTELLSRIAIGLDFPKEQLLGMGDANHWTAWLVDDQTWSAHLQPMANLLVEDLTGVYLQPMLKAQGVEDYASYVIGYDAAEVINHPDRNKDAHEMRKQGAIGDGTWREVGGFTDADAMSEEEYLIWLALQFKDAQMLPERFRPEKPEPPPQLLPPGLGGELPFGQDDPDEAVEGQPPAEGDQRAAVAAQQNGGLQASAYVSELSGVARATVRRARELAGSRIRTKVRKDENLNTLVNDKLRETANALVASTVGVEMLADAHIGSPRELVAGAGDGFGDIAAEFGLDPAVGRRIGVMLEDHAAKTLFEVNPAPVPPRLRAYLERVL